MSNEKYPDCGPVEYTPDDTPSETADVMKARQTLEGLDGVIGSGIGRNATGETTLIAYLSDQQEEKNVPAALGDLPVECVYVGAVDAY